jgi:hypothetical protein
MVAGYGLKIIILLTVKEELRFTLVYQYSTSNKTNLLVNG